MLAFPKCPACEQVSKLGVQLSGCCEYFLFRHFAFFHESREPGKGEKSEYGYGRREEKKEKGKEGGRWKKMERKEVREEWGRKRWKERKEKRRKEERRERERPAVVKPWLVYTEEPDSLSVRS